MKRGFSPLDVDVYGNNCIHHSAAGGRSEILETFLGQGVSVDHKNTRGHQPYDLATDSTIKEALQSARKARKCKQCTLVFDIYKTRHLCQECKKYFCTDCCRVFWVYLIPSSEEQQRPVCRCLNCQNYLVSVENDLKEALESGVFDKVDQVYLKIVTNNMDINVKLVDLAKIEHKRLKTEKEINQFIASLQYVQNYKTIQKSVYVLGEMLKKAQKQGVALAQNIIQRVEHQQKRLMSQRNLRHEVATADFSIASQVSVSTLDSLIGSAKQNKVQQEYTQTASVIRQKLQDNIDAHYILARFVDYPLREYPEPQILDPRKRGPAKQEEKKAPARRKKEPKLLIPDWATQIVSLIKEVEALQRFLRRAEQILLDPQFIEEAKQNIVRMRKEIRFRQQQEEEARLEAERRAAAKKSAAKK